ncbi:MAG TPA: hypothetical protein RMH85_08200 [Polyangiaceae bacterium LLY-WYZ-15_(1-7)]|nr:hypothetical protein [Myxococcales bacterium]MAT24119.1 hypothetical protein [Sandaracinus sp.]HJK90884.1 hypothetical protein [Polyangiaceae bacterium LLY-WYZ-15_(1-7)]MBJ72278.1 hypothetical protein [Sandaracinus sp.]HJL03076.1 hypothetical protein [Polyangiaceae bacterium LLY-WYZ-15_(1-7)]
MWIVGVDENGLGPRLGPLVATAAAIEVKRYDREALEALGAELRIGDSKQTSGFGRMRHAEGLALALAERASGAVPRHADELLAALSIDGLLALRAPCPDGITARQCWQEPLPLPAFGGDVEEGRALLAALEKGGVKVRRLRTALACAGRINEALAAGRSKLQVDLELFERLLLDVRAAARGDVEAICGMVGGVRKYGRYFRHFEGAEARESPKGVCAYAVPAVGAVRFEVKADDRHLPVGLASMVGKVVRELGMARLVGFYRGQDPELPVASGYHDPVTKRFVAGSETLRRSLPIADACFERRG